MSTFVVFVAGLLVSGFSSPLLLLAQQANGQPAAASGASAASPTPAPIPASASAMVNPVHPSAASLARAKQIYGFDCEICHGKNGNGVSEISPDAKMRNYQDPDALKNLTDGDIFYIIQNGRGTMPGEGPRAKPEEVWNLVLYLRSLSKGKT
jgi:mono/diheme cytochrome c family protein